MFFLLLVFDAIAHHRHELQLRRNESRAGKIYEFALKPSSSQYSHYYQHGMYDGNAAVDKLVVWLLGPTDSKQQAV